jgi:hypothetical protein
MEEGPDAGSDLVDRLAASLQLDDQWCVRAGRSFTWWGHRLAQQVWADAPVTTPSGPVTRVHAQVDVLAGITEDEGTAERVSALNRFAGLSALLWQPGTGEVALHTAVSVAPGAEAWLEPILAVATSTQAAEAHAQVEEWARMLGGQPAVTEHPTSGRRKEPDERLDVIAHVLAKVGGDVSPFGESDFEALLRIENAPWDEAEPSGAGLGARIPLPGTTQRATLTLSAESRHPVLGSGVFVRLALPSLPGAELDAAAAAGLNLAEARTFTPAQSLGAWCRSPEHGLAYLSFLPAAIYEPGLLHHIVEDAMLRLGWFGGRSGPPSD